MRELYVYYRVPAAHAAQALSCAQRCLEALRVGQPDLDARLLRRPGEVEGVETWMEVYKAPRLPGGVTPTLEATIERGARPLAEWIAGPRHVEVFEPVGVPPPSQA